MNKSRLQPIALAVMFSFVAGTASAGVMHNVTYGVSAATTAESTFLSSMYSSITEDFEDEGQLLTDATGSPAPVGESLSSNVQGSWLVAANTYSTKVGTFTTDNPESPIQTDDVNPEMLMIEGLASDGSMTGEFGRSGTGNWLDSNDADQVTWDIFTGQQFNAFGFYLSDANDQGAQLKLEYAGGGESEIITINADLDNGNLAYIAVWADQLVSSATMIFNNGVGENDGWGIDDVTVGRVPEPGTLALLGLGIAGLTAARRKQKA